MYFPCGNMQKHLRIQTPAILPAFIYIFLDSITTPVPSFQRQQAPLRGVFTKLLGGNSMRANEAIISNSFSRNSTSNFFNHRRFIHHSCNINYKGTQRQSIYLRCYYKFLQITLVMEENLHS